MNDFIKDFDVRNWLFQNILWVLFFSVLLVGGFKVLKSVFNAFAISKQILKDNRDTRGNGWGKYSADRFIFIWYSKPNLPLKYVEGEHFPLKFGINSRHWMNVIDNELERLGLIEIYDDLRKKYKAVKAVKNFRNKCVLCMTIFCLVHFTGDNKLYYLDLKNQSK